MSQSKHSEADFSRLPLSFGLDNPPEAPTEPAATDPIYPGLSLRGLETPSTTLLLPRRPSRAFSTSQSFPTCNPGCENDIRRTTPPQQALVEVFVFFSLLGFIFIFAPSETDLHHRF